MSSPLPKFSPTQIKNFIKSLKESKEWDAIVEKNSPFTYENVEKQLKGTVHEYKQRKHKPTYLKKMSHTTSFSYDLDPHTSDSGLDIVGDDIHHGHSDSESSSSSSDVSLSDTDSLSDSDHHTQCFDSYGFIPDSPYTPDTYKCPCDCEESPPNFYPGTYSNGYPCACPPTCFCDCSFNSMKESGSFD